LTVPPVLLPAASISAAGRLLALHDATHAVVIEGDRPVGIVSKRAIAAAHPSSATSLTRGEIRGHLDQVTVADIMLPDPLMVSPATPLAEAVRLMRDARASVLVVSDREGVVGLITANELLRALDRLIASESAGDGARSGEKPKSSDAMRDARADSGLDRIEHG
jgi:CBS domain-containing protein